MISVMNEIQSGNIYEKLKTKILLTQVVIMLYCYEEITSAKTMHMTNKLLKYNIYNYKKFTRITHGLLKSIR